MPAILYCIAASECPHKSKGGRRMKRMTTKKWILLLAVMAIVVALGACAGSAETGNPFLGTFWAIVPPLVAIVLALITKEVYLSLFLGILVGTLFYANFNPIGTITGIFGEGGGSIGMLSVVTDGWNAGILIFLVSLGIIGALITSAGGSAAYGRWAEKNIKTKVGAQFSTFLLGVLIFVDDYFNCLTVGSVMRPVTDKHQISRAKLAYLIDSTAAPICIIAPISSWAAAVAGSLETTGGYSQFQLFVNSIPFNFYAVLTLVFIVCLIFMKFDFGPMKKHEINAANGDLYTTAARPYADVPEDQVSPRGKMIDLILPIIVLIAFCILGLAYTGGWKLFGGEANLAQAFADCDASLGLVYGCFVTMVIMFIYFLARRVLTLKQFADTFVVGFRSMVPAILILVFAWTLSAITLELGLRDVVADFILNQAQGLQRFLPVIICLIAMGLSFSTGTSWGTFGMLLPIVISVFPFGAGNDNLAFVGIAACLSGAVFGDHCSPISDTTIMSSAGAQSDHINHVLTQMPYGITCGVISLVMFLFAGFVPQWFIVLPVGIVVTVATMFVIRKISRKRTPA